MTKRQWLDKPYNNLNAMLREKFGKKVIKLSVDGGFSCPNRDGKISTGGCVFCSESGSGDFAGARTLSITEQIETQIQLLKDKWPDALYMVYFQNFSTTYGSVEKMERLFREAMIYPNVVGLAIATRVDCINEPVLDLLEAVNKETYIWVELGLQSISLEHHKLLNTGYTPKQFQEAVQALGARGIDVVGHIILSLPNWEATPLEETINFLNKLPIKGLKLHMLNVLKETALEKIYAEQSFSLLELEVYLQQVVYIIERLNPEIVIHRVTGDGAKDLLIAPRWILNKRKVLNELIKKFKVEDTYQGKFLN